MAYTRNSLIPYPNAMFEEVPEVPEVPVGDAEELDPQTLTPAEREALGLTEKTPEAEETAQ